MMAPTRALVAAAVIVVLVASCAADPGADTSATADPGSDVSTTAEAGTDTSEAVDFGALLGGPAPPMPSLDTFRVQRGEAFYQQYCASCHGADLEGAADWMTLNADGTWKPPPHDSSGHTWHHSDQLLSDIIRDGGGFPETQMPGFASVLSDSDIADILEYLKANWGDQERAFQWQITWQATNRDSAP